MSTTIISSIIASLIILLITSILAIVKLSYKLKLYSQENENIRLKYSNLEKKQSDFKGEANKEITRLQKKISDLEDEDIFIGSGG